MDRMDELFEIVEVQDTISTIRDFNETVDKLNEIVGDFVYKHLFNDGIFNEDKYNYLKQIKRTYDKRKSQIENQNYKKPFMPNETKRLAKEFLTFLGPKYIDALNKCEEDDSFTLLTYEMCLRDKIIPMSHSYYDAKEDKSYINLLVYFDASDVYTLIHETVHITNLYKKDQIIDELQEEDYPYFTWALFTEAISYLAEHIAVKYFEKNHPEEKDLFKDNYRAVKGHRLISKQVSFMFDLLDRYLGNSQIVTADLISLLSDDDKEYIQAATYQVSVITKDNYFDIINKLSYLLSDLISEYVIENNSFEDSVKIFDDLNDMITYDKIENIFKFLGIDAKEIDKWFVKIDEKELSLFNKRNGKW